MLRFEAKKKKVVAEEFSPFYYCFCLLFSVLCERHKLFMVFDVFDLIVCCFIMEWFLFLWVD